jgi:hypothetical protein
VNSLPAWPRPQRIAKIKPQAIPEGAGLYVIRANRKIDRVGGRDSNGTVYIGKSQDLRRRLVAFWNCHHHVSDFLWCNPRNASQILGKTLVDSSAVERAIEELSIRWVRVHGNRTNKTERLLLTVYLDEFGELPPLNFSQPGRWDLCVTAAERSWARNGLR